MGCCHGGNVSSTIVVRHDDWVQLLALGSAPCMTAPIIPFLEIFHTSWVHCPVVPFPIVRAAILNEALIETEVVTDAVSPRFLLFIYPKERDIFILTICITSKFQLNKLQLKPTDRP